MSVIDDEVAALRTRLDELQVATAQLRRRVAETPGWLFATDPGVLRAQHPQHADGAVDARDLAARLGELAGEELAVQAALDATVDDDAAAPLDVAAGAGVLLPLRLETRFTRPQQDAPAGSEQARWLLRVRVEPDAVALAAPPAPPTPQEADLVARCWGECGGSLSVDDGWAAFGRLAERVGGPRAAHLLRTVAVAPGADGGFDPLPLPADATTGATAQPLAALPRRLHLWGQRAGSGAWDLLATLEPRHELIAAQSRLAAVVPTSRSSTAPLPRTWWNSFSAAEDVGLAVRLPLDDDPATEPVFTALVCAGLGGSGDDDRPDVVDLPTLWRAHADAGRLGTLAALTPTNTVAGRPTTDLGRHPGTWFEVARSPAGSGGELPWALGGGRVLRGVPDPDRRLPAVSSSLVTALWPVLWQRALKDVLGVGELGWRLGEWATRHLHPFGPLPVLRVDDLPYGLLPVGPALPWEEVEAPSGLVPFPVLRRWPGESVVEAGVAATAEYLGRLLRPADDDPGPPAAADADALLDRLSEVPTSPAYGSRSLPLLATFAVLQAFYGPAEPADEVVTRWRERWRETFLVDLAREVTPLGPVRPFPERAGTRTQETVERYLGTAWESLAHMDELSEERWEEGEPPSILARLVRHSLLLTQAEVSRLTDPDVPWQPVFHLADADADELADLAGRAGVPSRELSPEALDLLPQLAPGSVQLAVLRQFEDVRTAAGQLVQADPEEVSAALPAAVDCAQHRVDAWDTAVAHRRLRRLAAAGAPWRVGACGWVDDLRPSSDPTPPTEAGLVHAPGYAQVLTAAVLRDHAVHDPDGPDAGRWALRLGSREIRAAARLGEGVAAGAHPSEALGREVERLVGEPGRVLDLRRLFPARPEWAGRRVCDGQRVLDATAPGAAEAARLPGWFTGQTRAAVEALHEVVDAYADLLLADAVHDVVSGRVDAAAEALEAAAGLGAPPELRLLRTRREGTTVRTRVCVALPWQPDWADRADAAAGSLTADGPGAMEVVDPALVELLRAETAEPRRWTWTSSATGALVTLRDLGLGLGDVVVLGARRLGALVTTALAGEPDGGTAPAHLARVERVTSLLAGGIHQDGDAPALARRRAWLEGEVRALVTSLRDPDPAAVRRALGVARRLGVDPPRADGPQAGDAERGEAAALVLEGRLAAVVTPGALGAPPGAGGAPTASSESAALRALLAPALGLPLVCPSPRPEGRAAAGTDERWLAVVAAVRPAMALLEVSQLTTTRPWVSTVTGGGTPWRAGRRTRAWDGGDEEVTVTYRSRRARLPGGGAAVGLVVLDSWAETIPSPEHTTWAAFGFDAPRARAPQALLLAVPPDPGVPWSPEDVRDVVVQARRLARSRGAPPPLRDRLALGLPTAMVLHTGPAGARLTGEV